MFVSPCLLPSLSVSWSALFCPRVPVSSCAIFPSRVSGFWLQFVLLHLVCRLVWTLFAFLEFNYPPLLLLFLDFDADQMSLSQSAHAPHMPWYRNNFYVSCQRLQQSGRATWSGIWYLWGKDKSTAALFFGKPKISDKKKKEKKKELTTIVFWTVTSCCHFVLTVCLCSPPSRALNELWIQSS